MRKTLTTMTLTVAACLSLGLPGAAQASTPDYSPTVRTTHGDGTGDHGIAGSHTLPGGRLAVRMEDGSTFDVRPCRYEDGHRCWWDAGRVGNHEGSTFVAILGTRQYLTH